MKYRIIAETEKSGKVNYYVQKRKWYLLWEFVVKKDKTNIRKFSSIENAKFYIQQKKEEAEKLRQSKIVKREILT